MPKLPSSGATGRLRSPTTQLPLKRSGPGKVVVMLSSVAKPPPAGTQALPAVPSSATPTPPRVTARPAVPPPSPAAPAASPPKVDPISQRLQSPPPLPPKQVSHISPVSPMPPSRLSTTTFVKLPPKTANPSLVTLTGKPAAPIPSPAALPTPAPVAKPKEPLASVSPPAAPAKVVSANPATPPPLPAKKTSQALSRKTGAHYIPPIKLHELSDEPPSAEDSIFASADTSTPTPKPAGWKELETGELPLPAGGLKNLDVFERSQKLLDKPASLIPPAGVTTTSPIVTPARRPLPLPTPATPPHAPEAKDKSAPPPLVAPPLRPPARIETKVESKTTGLNPPPLSPSPIKPPEPPPMPPVHVAPPLLEKTPEPAAAKLPQPNTPAEPPKSAPPPLAEPPAIHKVPALIPPEAAPAKPLQAPATSLAKSATDWLKKTAPLVLPSSAPATPPSPVAEAKPALKAPVLPKRALLKEADTHAIPATPVPPVVIETKDATKKVDAPVSTAKPPATTPALPPKLPEKEPAPTAPAAEKKPTASSTAPAPEKSAATAPPPLKTDNPPVAAWAAPLVPLAKAVTAVGDAATAATTSSPKATSPIAVKLPEKDPSAPSTTGKLKAAPGVTAAMTAATAKPTAPVAPAPKAKAPLPKTRVERARQRRFVATLLFWAVILPITIFGLVFGSLYFGRKTRVEGQVIPPPGMSLNSEIWIVTDFSSLASGIAEDLAQERTPIMLEIQERQEHVQRTQADVASREERIRLIQEQISGAKAEIDSIVKKSRNETQQIWTGEGAAIENEYQSHFDQLKKAIADRAKSLNLQYEPDETYQSPEVWANAYRLALYQVPPGVDSAKEHQWLSDQMKQWRDLQKTLDARKAQLREKAAQVKLEPAPRITDLNAKIEDLQQRVDSTTSEEIPLKAELQQAQVSLADAQAADANLDDKYFKQLYSLPGEATTKRIPLKSNGRFTWDDDNNFMEGEKEHRYMIFSRATRSDGRQYWALHHFSIGKDQTVELIFEPGGFLSTKAILRPNLSPEEQEQ